MKLTITRTKETKGIFRSVTVFYLNLEVEVTSEEMALLAREDRWEYGLGSRNDVIVRRDGRQLTARNFVGGSTCWKFETVEDLEKMEHQVIDLMKHLKRHVEWLAIKERQEIEHAEKLKQQAANFTSEGPYEVEL
jgi:hypothetical protein